MCIWNYKKEMLKNKNRKGFFLELYKIMKLIKVFNKLNK